MSAAQTDHFDHDCNAWQGGWCPGRLEAKSKDVGRSSNGDRASYLKCHRICTTLYFVGTGPVFLLYFSVLQLNFLACNVLQLNSFCSKVYWQWSKIPFPKQQSLKFHQTAFIFRDFCTIHFIIDIVMFALVSWLKMLTPQIYFAARLYPTLSQFSVLRQTVITSSRNYPKVLIMMVTIMVMD